MAPQFSTEQCIFMTLEYSKKKGTKGFKDRIIQDFQAKFPGIRSPSTNQIRNIWHKFKNTGTINNLNSKTSPGPSYSGRRKTTRTLANTNWVKVLMDRDALKEMGDRAASLVNTSRRSHPDSTNL